MRPSIFLVAVLSRLAVSTVRWVGVEINGVVVRFQGVISRADDHVEKPSVLAGFSIPIEFTRGCRRDASGGSVIKVLKG